MNNQISENRILIFKYKKLDEIENFLMTEKKNRPIDFLFEPYKNEYPNKPYYTDGNPIMYFKKVL
jgi:hypothetical protein